MKKRFKRLWGKKGVTLVELIVVLAVSSIILGIAMGMLLPVSRLMDSIKSNAGMDAACDTINEYIRSSLQNATGVSIFNYPDGSITSDADAMKTQWEEYEKDASKGYKIKALAILRNYNDDYRLYDFGDVTTFNDPRFYWGASFHPTTIDALIHNRDGGGRWAGGLDFNEFHRFDALHEAFYCNGSQSGELNYSFQVCFDFAGKALVDEDGNPIPDIEGVNYLTLKSQIFKRTGKTVFDHYDADGNPVFSSMASFEPVNQLRSVSFNLFNGNASLDSAKKINKTVTENGAEIIDTSAGMSGVIILYQVRDLEGILP